MNNQLKVKVNLIDGKMNFQGNAEEKNIIRTNYIHGKNPSEHTPLEIFLLSLSACLGGTVSALLRNQNKNIISLNIETKGFRRGTHPTSFEKIIIKLNLISDNTNSEDLNSVIKISEEKICPVLSMIKESVNVEIYSEIGGSDNG